MSQSDFITDRRSHERRVMHGNARLTTMDSRSFSVNIADISPSGIRVIAPINPRTGTNFILSVRLPLKPSGSLPVELKVRVAFSILIGSEDGYSDGFSVGLNFLGLPEEARDAINDYLDV
ncbi:type IV pilus assembly PilZ [Thiorhodococcus drewsii AZ1]|uniref:Type IV pilus assembly PilZ n=1 Tax=Thiorhodococcus drewsii AZ1 TaxID=765913 RepID=G2E6K6_9GAMM|nr:PilZ domain-containing protein [Thiorhodococcus drewsii]EGV28290.1 type IV pilus assembly PilZ [Thiorhodococcus drewsii AZ1]